MNLNYLKQFNLLIVDDSKAVRDSFCEFFENKFKTIICANDGEDGLKKYKENNIDLVIADLKMPKKDGLEMSKDIRDINPNAIIMILTSHADNELLNKAIDLNIDGFVLKPMRGDKIIASIYKCLVPLINQIQLNKSQREVEEVNQKLQFDIQKAIKEIEKKEEDLVLQSRLAEMGEMIALISHQWKQPLNTISGTLGLLKIKSQMGQLDNDTITKNTTNLEAQVQLMSQTMDDFKQFFLPNTKNEELNIIDIINSTLKFMEYDIKYHNIKVTSIDENDNIKISSNKNYMIQVMMNLVKNIIDIFKEKSIKDPAINFDIRSTNRTIKISVSDNAGGIPSNILPHIFDKYFTSGKENGTGLGLYMSRLIIQKHLNGDLIAQNTDNGAKFTMIINK